MMSTEVEITEDFVKINGMEVSVLKDGIELGELREDDCFTVTLTLLVDSLHIHLAELNEFIEELGLTEEVANLPDEETGTGGRVDYDAIHDYIHVDDIEDGDDPSDSSAVVQEGDDD